MVRLPPAQDVILADARSASHIMQQRSHRANESARPLNHIALTRNQSASPQAEESLAPFIVSKNAFVKAYTLCGMSANMALNFAAALEEATAAEENL